MKSKQAEDAAAVAHANADKAIKLLKVSEESSRQVDEFRKEHELRLKKLEELAATVGPFFLSHSFESLTSKMHGFTSFHLAMQDKDAQRQKDDYAKARQAAQEKAAEFDKVRNYSFEAPKNRHYLYLVPILPSCLFYLVPTLPL